MKMDFWIFILFLLQLQTCAALEVTVPSNPETGMARSSVLLPCIFSLDFQQMEPKSLSVRWIFGNKVLLMFTDRELTSYGRARLNKEAAMNGNATLLLYDLKVEDEGTYTCSVEYNGELRQQDVVLRVQASPSVDVASYPTTSDDEIHLDCLVKGFYPKEVKVTWYRNGKVVNKSDVITGEPRREGNGTYDINSTLLVILSKVEKDDKAECQVEHVTLGTPIKEHFILTPIGAALEVTVPSNPETGMARSSVLLPCIFSLDFQQMEPKSLSVRWIFGNKVLLMFTDRELTSYGRARLNKEAAMNGNATLLLYDLKVEDEGTYTCSVEYNGELRQKDVVLRVQASPSVDVASYPTTSDDEIHLDCLVKGFYPKEVKVTWYRNGKVVNKSDVITGEPRREGNGTYDINSTLLVILSKVEKDDKAECQVEHVTLGTPIKEHFILTPIDLKRNSTTLIAVSVVSVFLVMAVCRGVYRAFCIRRKSKSNISDEEAMRPLKDLDPALQKSPRMGKIEVPRLVHGTQAQLNCTISGYFPANLKVTWLWMKPGATEYLPVSSSDNKIGTVSMRHQDDKTYTSTASLSINVSVLDEHSARYMCQIHHPSLESPLQEQTRKLSVIASPVVNVMHETRKKKTYLKAVIEGIFPKTASITWSRTRYNCYINYLQTDGKNKESENADGTFNIICRCRDKQSQAKKTKRFKVTVNHESLALPIVRTILREEGVYYLLTENGREILLATSDV
uniref:Ig-like domain-containing protein n=1 Tax=Leptobrachium leishanense TaxID=445787 RepID=A0A8C5PJ06_9ANUR